MIKNTIISLLFMMLSFSFANAKDDLTILNTGSKTGGFSKQSLAYYTDLSKYKKDFGLVNLVNPGNPCVAINNLLPKIDGMLIMPWGSDMEAKYPTACGATIDMTKARVIKFVEKYQYLCTANGQVDVTRDAGRVGFNKVNGGLPKTIKAINDSFATKHKQVGYDGWGAAIIAMFNGEVDYVIVSPPGNAQVEAKGGECMPLSRSDDSLWSKHDSKSKNPDLVASNIDTWLVYNATDEQAKSLTAKIKKVHFECDTSMSKLMQGCDKEGTSIQTNEWKVNKQFFTRWEDSVAWNTAK